MGRSNVGSDPIELVQQFVDAVKDKDTTIFVGIDPGATGAIALICGRRATAVDIPNVLVTTRRVKKTNAKERAKTNRKSKTIDSTSTSPDFPGICAIFRVLREVKERIVIALEEVPATIGPGKHHADIMLNRSWAIWPLFLYSKGYSVENVKPTIWKRKMRLYKKPKTYSLKTARSLWPKAPLDLAKHHDRAEALLMALYVQQLHAGQ